MPIYAGVNIRCFELRLFDLTGIWFEISKVSDIGLQRYRDFKIRVKISVTVSRTNLIIYLKIINDAQFSL